MGKLDEWVNMFSNIVAGYIIFELTEFDWKRDWKNFLADLKELIPSDQREYDSKDKVWRVLATSDNQMHFRALKKRYFEDENQESLEL